MMSTEHPVTVLLADDHPTTRAGIRAILEAEADMQVVGEAENGFEAQKLVAELGPKILVLDLQMPGPSPYDLERWVRHTHPETQTVILTAHGRDAHLAMMMEAGASGFLSKTEPAQNLAASIRRLAAGKPVYSDEQIERALRWRREAGGKWNSLSQREKEILPFLVRGLKNADIARELGVTPKTVAFHITNILEKLGVNTRGEAVDWVNQYAPKKLNEPSG